VAAYHVSGEYSMLKAAAERGWIDGPAVALEQLTANRRVTAARTVGGRGHRASASSRAR
jgi:delta-aminolevulinic acid dehydratase/porphobilinogen synthase